MNASSIPAGSLKYAWGFCLLIICANFIVSVICANTNHNTHSGHKSTGFCAIWMTFLLLGFGILGSKIIFSGKSTNLFIGLLLGGGWMLVQLNFAFAIYFFKIESHKEYDHNGNQTNKSEIEDVNSANDNMGAFAIINTLVFALWTGLLHFKKGELYVDDLQGTPESVDQNDYDGAKAIPTAPPVTDDYDETMVNQSL